MFWWLIHGIIAAMIVHLETTRAHNYVAALLIMPEFSLDRIQIGYLFTGSNRRDSGSTAVFCGYAFLVAIFMGIFGCAMKGLLMIAAVHDVDDIILIAALALVISSLAIGPVDAIRFFSLTVGSALLLGLATFYVFIGLQFIPVLYVLILSVSAVDEMLSNMGPS